MKLFLFETLQEALLVPSQPCSHSRFLLAQPRAGPHRLSSPAPAAGTNSAFSSLPLQEIKFFVARLLKHFCTVRLEMAI